MIQRILVPLDGSPGAKTALPHAVRIAAALGARVDLMQVIPGSGEGLDDALAFRLTRADRGKYLESLASRLRLGGLNVGTVVEAGEPAEAILGTLRREAYDLVALSAHGARAQAEAPLGHTAVAVALNTPTSILIVPAVAPGNGGPTDPDGPIVALVDGTPKSDQPADIAATIATRSGSRLVLLHVLDAREAVRRLADGGDRRWQAAKHMVRESATEIRRHLVESAERLAFKGLAVDVGLIETTENPVRVLCGAIEAEGATLVVLGAHRDGMPGKWPLGGTAVKLIFSSHCPILVLRLGRVGSMPPTVDPETHAARSGHW